MVDWENMADESTIDDDDALRQYLEAELGPADRFEVTPQEGGSGSSNQTVFVTWGPDEFVLRGAPSDERVPYLLHDVLAEYEILSALTATAIPAPEPVAVCRDRSVLGTPFYLMERIPGDTLGDGEPERFATPERRRQVGEAMIDTLASLHTLDHEHLDVREVPEGTLEEAVAAHTANLRDAFETTDRELTRALEVGDWLRENVPEPPDRALVHGDYKTDNLLFGLGGRDASPDERAGEAREQWTPPHIAAVLDWEMAGIGNPHADLGWFVGLWTEAKDPDPVTPEFEAEYGDHDLYDAIVEGTSFTTNPGYPSRVEFVDRYEERTETEFEHQRFYRALGLYKLTTICEKFHEAYLRNPEEAKATYPVMEVLAPLLAERAALVVEGEVPL